MVFIVGHDGLVLRDEPSQKIWRSAVAAFRRSHYDNVDDALNAMAEAVYNESRPYWGTWRNSTGDDR